MAWCFSFMKSCKLTKDRLKGLCGCIDLHCAEIHLVWKFLPTLYPYPDTFAEDQSVHLRSLWYLVKHPHNTVSGFDIRRDYHLSPRRREREEGPSDPWRGLIVNGCCFPQRKSNPYNRITHHDQKTKTQKPLRFYHWLYPELRCSLNMVLKRCPRA